MRVASSDWCASRIVVSVTRTRVSLAHPVGEFSARAVEQCAASPSGAAADGKCGALGLARVGRRLRPALGLGMAVDGDVGDIGEEFGRAVAALLDGEQLRRFVDEARRVVVGAEFRMIEHRFEKGEVGGDAADAVFAQERDPSAR